MAKKGKYTLEERFWSKIDRRGPDDCWEWQGTRSAGGYGQVGYDYKLLYAHRVSYEIAKGPIPQGLFVCHKCDNPPCCNPTHLFLGTNAQNLRDMANKHRGKGPRLIGEKHPGAILTESKVKEIRRLYSAGMFDQTQLGEMFGVTHFTIYRIVHNQTWKHVTQS